MNFSHLRYNLLLLLGSPIIFLYLMQRFVSGKSRQGWAERWGRLPEKMLWNPTSKPTVWIHAVSAGEVVAAVPIIRELRALLPNHQLLLSVITPAGHEIAAQQAQKFVDGIFFLPFDFPWVVNSVVQRIHPALFISLESELWPNLLHELKKQGAKTVMVNGRISEKSFARSKKYASWLFKWMLANMDSLLMQSESDARRIMKLAGSEVTSDKIQVVGNSKFDQEVARLSQQETGALRAELGFPHSSPIFVVGSSRSPEEEAIVIEAYLAMRAKFSELCLLIAPRQIERAEELAQAMRNAGLTPIRRTQLKTQNFAEVRHLILDTIGELANVYALATFAFVGNSFDPVVKGGGQNLIQPLAHGKPALFGPRHATIRSEVALVLDAGVGFEVKDGKSLAEEGIRLLEGEDYLNQIERKALALVEANRGVSKKYAALAIETLHSNTVHRSDT